MSKRISLSRLALLSLGVAMFGVAHAQFTTAFAGPINSDGPIGTITNDSFTNTYLGPNALFGSYRLRGRLTEVNTGTFASEARWNLKNNTTGNSVNFQAFTSTNFTGFLDADVTIPMLSWINTGDTFRFEAFESFNDSGIDANWTNGSHEFSGTPTILDLGNFANGSSFVFDTFTSNFDTELALYTETGTLLLDNDDFGGLQSKIDAGILAMGCYYLVSTGFDAGFANGFALPGNAAGSIHNVQLNGTTVSTGAHTARGMRVHKLCVVPEPASMAALGLGAVALIRRRRKNS